eukprot:2559014-Pyramimonas_sp.AAC.1
MVALVRAHHVASRRRMVSRGRNPIPRRSSARRDSDVVAYATARFHRLPLTIRRRRYRLARGAIVRAGEGDGRR